MGIELYSKCIHLLIYNRWPDINNPKWFSEKILHRLFRTNDPRFALLSDKLNVRDYITEKIGEDILVPLLGVYDKIHPEDIKALNKDRIVLKNNHDSGSTKIVDTANDDLDAICAYFNENIKKTYGIDKGEYWYKFIKPKIIAEQFIGEDSGRPPSDYRFHMFNQKNGDFEIVLSINYYDENIVSVTFYDESLRILPFSAKSYPNNKVSRKSTPEFEKAKNIAKLLAIEFDYVRIDMYISNNRVYFGEFTFAHTIGRLPMTPMKYNLWMGNLWK